MFYNLDLSDLSFREQEKYLNFLFYDCSFSRSELDSLASALGFVFVDEFGYVPFDAEIICVSLLE